MSESHVNARSRRSFVRDGALVGLGLGTIGVASRCGDPPTDGGTSAGPAPDGALAGAAGPKWLVVDASLPRHGTSVSLDAHFDASLPPGSYASDIKLCGAAVFPGGRIFGGTPAPVSAIKSLAPAESYCVKLGKSYANALALVSRGGESYHVTAGGDPQPLGAPWDIRLRERIVPGTAVRRLTGWALDPSTGLYVHFTITHDPAPIVVIGIVAGIVALVCGAIVLTDEIKDKCINQANAQCGQRGVKKITVNRTYGFAWSKGFRAGCGTDCEIECH
jgi:hypothetical protein